MAAAVFSTDLVEIATQAIEAVAGLANIYSQFKLIKVAEGYYDLYAQQKEWYYQTFQAGLESPLAGEVYAIQKPTLNYANTVLSAYNIETGPFGGKATDAKEWWERHAGAYGLGMDPRLQHELKSEILRVKSDWTNYLFRFAETYYDLENDLRWKKRMALHNIGLKTGTAVASALQGALGEFQNHVADFGNQLATYGNGIARYTGYKEGLADTSQAFDRGGYDPIRIPDNATRGINYSYGEVPA